MLDEPTQTAPKHDVPPGLVTERATPSTVAPPTPARTDPADAVPTDAELARKPRSPEGGGRVSVASQRQLIWWRFRRHKLAVVSAFVIGLFYLVVAGGDFFAYSDPQETNAHRIHVPPQAIHFDGLSPYVYGLTGTRDLDTFEEVYTPDTNTKIKVRLFASGYQYKLFGLIPTDIHLIGTEGAPAEPNLFLLGSDEQGRDIFSRLVLATRTSLLVGLVGVTLSLVLGVALGGISGYYGGAIDSAIQRIIEFLNSIPTIPLWMGLAAAIPPDFGVTQTYFVLSGIISLIGWTQLGREVRGRFMQVRGEDFILAAELAGARPRRVIFVHMLPLFASHIIASTTLALPFMILAETLLSFLGLGLRPPAISWGVMLQQAQNVQSIALFPWMLLPVVPVVVAILAFNFIGDGLRDAADPYDN